MRCAARARPAGPSRRAPTPIISRRRRTSIAPPPRGSASSRSTRPTTSTATPTPTTPTRSRRSSKPSATTRAWVDAYKGRTIELPSGTTIDDRRPRRRPRRGQVRPGRQHAVALAQHIARREQEARPRLRDRAERRRNAAADDAGRAFHRRRPVPARRDEAGEPGAALHRRVREGRRLQGRPQGVRDVARRPRRHREEARPVQAQPAQRLGQALDLPRLRPGDRRACST